MHDNTTKVDFESSLKHTVVIMLLLMLILVVLYSVQTTCNMARSRFHCLYKHWLDTVNSGTWAKKQQFQLVWEDSEHLLKGHFHWIKLHSDRNKTFYSYHMWEVSWSQLTTTTSCTPRHAVTFSEARQPRNRNPEQLGGKDDILKL